MTLKEFQQLKEEDIIWIPGQSGSPGVQKMVVKVSQDIDGRTQRVAIIDALDPLGAQVYEVLADFKTE